MTDRKFLLVSREESYKIKINHYLQRATGFESENKYGPAEMALKIALKLEEHLHHSIKNGKAEDKVFLDKIYLC